MESHRDITPKSSMQEILQAYPNAQRALFAWSIDVDPLLPRYPKVER